MQEDSGATRCVCAGVYGVHHHILLVPIDNNLPATILGLHACVAYGINVYLQRNALSGSLSRSPSLSSLFLSLTAIVDYLFLSLAKAIPFPMGAHKTQTLPVLGLSDFVVAVRRRQTST